MIRSFKQAARQGLRHSLRIDELIALCRDQGPHGPPAAGAALDPARLGSRRDPERSLPGFLADPDPLIRFAAIQWVGEHRLEPFRPQLLAGLASSAATRNLFEATLAALEQLDGRCADPRDELAGEDYIVALLNDPRTPASVLRARPEDAPADHPALTLDRLHRFATGSDQAVAIEAVRTLSQGPSPADSRS